VHLGRGERSQEGPSRGKKDGLDLGIMGAGGGSACFEYSTGGGEGVRDLLKKGL